LSGASDRRPPDHPLSDGDFVNHQGIHFAFVQAESFHVNRLDASGQVESVEFGEFGIHLHSGGPGVLVDRFSAIVDLNHDNAIDMVKAANDGVEAVIHKTSESASFKDPAYLKRRTAALDAWLLWGAYHFSSARDVAD
jgi:hypothetical protein